MKRRTVAAFAALSLIAAVLAAGSVAYRVLRAEERGKRAASTDFQLLLSELSGVRSSADLAEAPLRARLAAHYRACPSLLLVAIYERGSGLRWRIPDRSDYLPASEDREAFPSPTYPERSSLLISAPLKGDPTGRLAVDALYSTLDQSTVFAAFRDALLALAAYLAAAAALLAALAAASRGRVDSSWSSGAPAQGGSGGEPGPSPYAPPEEDFSVPEMGSFEAEANEAPATVKDQPPLPEEGARERGGDAGLYSPASGLGWESYQAERLDAELARSASFEQDLSLLALSYDGIDRGSPAYAATAKAIVDFFTFRDLAFERGEEGFTVILSNLDIDAALRMAEEFFKKLTFLLRDYRRDPLEALPVFIGLSSRAGRLVDSGRITQEAIAALQKAREDCDTHIIAFRPDADKYRLYLSSKGC
ncbi:MAG TPA: hypothetical protein PLB91_16300 [Spirochaetales bacterium]|nr:hypothetical protein [Spirochaetales bacterium]HRY54705.1 hypothetical protein [Spirochaetia bacterium]